MIGVIKSILITLATMLAAIVVSSAVVNAEEIRGDNAVLICSCGVPAIIIHRGIVEGYNYPANGAHVNQVVNMACKERTMLPGADVYYVEDATGKPCKAGE